MNNENFIKGSNEEEVWQQIRLHFVNGAPPLQYTAIIDQGNFRIILDIDIDPGGGFESGFETTTLSASVSEEKGFYFAIHKEHLTDEIGKFFGMQDVITGYDDFDKKLIIKTNNVEEIKVLFKDTLVREVLVTLNDFTFTLTKNKEDHKLETLELMVENAITDINELRRIYRAFYSVLQSIRTTF